MKNIDMQVQGDILTVKVDLKKEFGPSASGKTTIIATTEGNVTVPEHENIKIGINVYRKNNLPKNELHFGGKGTYGRD